MDPHVPESLLPDLDLNEASIDSLTEDIYASEDESALTTYTISSIYDDDRNGRTASANSLYEDQELSAILGDSVYSVEVSALEDEDMQDESEEDEDASEPGDIPISYENANILNESYKLQLMEMLDQLHTALEKNRTRQEEIHHEMQELQDQAAGKTKEAGPNSFLRKALIFGVPYFKDVNMFGPPPNSDTRKKRALREIDHYLTTPKPWSTQEKEKCRAAIREEAILLKLKHVIKEQTDVLMEFKKLNPVDDKEEREVKLKRLRELKREEDQIRDLSDQELFDDIYEDYDWMKISAQCFDAAISPESCRLMWQNLLHPSINKSKWTSEEDTSLRELVQMYTHRDWELISSELDTGRTPFQCFHRYTQHHKKELTSALWTTKEDKRLVELVDKCRINNYIPWAKVAYYMQNRTKDQCYQRWNLSAKNGIRRGHFLEIEDFLIIIGIKLLGKNWAKISEIIPQRGPSQIHSRFNAFLKADFTRWTKDEDYKLLELVQRHTHKNWRLVAQDMPTNKHRSQCRRRFHHIFRNFTKCGGLGLAQLAYKKQDDSIQHKRQQKLLTNLEKKIRDRFGFGFSTKDSNSKEMSKTVFTIHNLIDELSISTDELRVFLEDLCKEVPRDENLWYDIPKRTYLSNKMLGMMPNPKPFKVSLKRDKDGNLVQEVKKQQGRPPKNNRGFLKELDMARKKVKIEKAFSKFFHPSYEWNTLNVGRPKKNQEPSDQSGNVAMLMYQYAKMLQFSPESNPAHQYLGQLSGRAQVWQAFEKLARETPNLVTTVGSVPVTAQPAKPTIRTYSRKKLTPISQTPLVIPENSKSQTSIVSSSSTTPPASNCLSLIPPNRSSLVAMRGLLLLLNRLKRISGESFATGPSKSINCGLGQEAPLSAPTLLKIREEQGRKSQQAADGPVPSTSKSGQDSSKLSPEQANKFLKERFLSLFFWPGYMSLHKPRPLTNIFGEDEADILTANDPFDASDVIRDAKANEGKTQRIVVRKAVPRVQQHQKEQHLGHQQQEQHFGNDAQIAQIEEIYVPVTTADLSDFSCMESAGVSDFSHEATDIMSGDIDLTTAVISGHVDVAPRPQKKRILAQAFQDDPTFMSNET